MDPADPAVFPLPSALRLLARRGTPHRFRKGALLIREGEQADTLFIVASGRVKAFSVDDRLREITYGTHGPGEYVGEMSLDGGPRWASVVALEDTTCFVVPREALRTHLAAHPEFAFDLLQRVIRRARQATDSARSLALLDVYGRLVKAIDGLSEGDPPRIPARPTHQELASRVGASREMVSKLMKDLQRGGYVANDGRALVILRPLPPRW